MDDRGQLWIIAVESLVLSVIISTFTLLVTWQHGFSTFTILNALSLGAAITAYYLSRHNQLYASNLTVIAATVLWVVSLSIGIEEQYIILFSLVPLVTITPFYWQIALMLTTLLMVWHELFATQVLSLSQTEVAIISICGFLFIIVALTVQNHVRQVLKTSYALLDAQSKRLTIAIEQSPSSIVLTDTDGNIVYVNPKFEEVTGYTATEAFGQNPRILKSGHTHSDEYQYLWDQISQGGEWHGEFHNKRKDGSLYWERASISPIKDDNGTLTHYIAIKEDITEQKEAIAALRRSESRFRQMFTQNQAIQLLINAKTGYITEANPAAQNFYGYDENKFKALRLHTITAMSEAETDQYIHLVMSGNSTTLPLQHRIADDSLRDVKVHSSPVIINGDHFMFIIVTDVTRNRQIETAYYAQQKRLELTIQGAKLGTWDWNITTGEVNFNDRWATMLDYKPDEIKPIIEIWEKLVHPHDLPLVKAALQEHLEGSTPSYTTEYRMRTKDNRWLWVYDAGQVVERDHNGTPLRATGIHIDINERKQADFKLKETQDKLKMVLEQGRIAWWEMELPSGIVRYDDAKAKMMGFAPQEFQATSYHDFTTRLHPDDYEASMQAMSDHLEGKSPHYEIDYRIMSKSGEYIWFYDLGHIVETSADKTIIRGLVMDITERKRNEENEIELAINRERLNILARFIEGTSHEFRTPLSLINTNTYLIQKAIDDPKVHERTQRIEKQVEHLTQLVDMMLIMAKLDTTNMIETTPIDINGLIEAVIQSTELQSKKIIYITNDHMDTVIDGDGYYLRIAINELLLNALKHNENPTISVMIKQQEQGLQIIIQDNGDGIHIEHAPHIFKRFYRADQSHSSPGFGLGLAMVQKIMELHQGTVDIQSTPEKGTAATLHLPAISIHV